MVAAGGGACNLAGCEVILTWSASEPEGQMETRTVSVRELRANLSAILRRVEQGETIEIARRGRVVARLVPALATALPPLTEAEISASLASLDAFAEEIGKQVTEPTNVAEMLADMRR